MKLKFEIVLDVDTKKFSCDTEKIISEGEETKKVNVRTIAELIEDTFLYLSKEYPKKFKLDNDVESPTEGKLN